MTKRVVIDFDNTMGVRGCDVDDGLALLYLLGSPGVRVEAACTTYGNSDIATVTHNTRRLFDEWGLNLPVYEGAASPANPDSAAARYLAQAASEHPGGLHLLQTGSTTNARGALQCDPRFFENLASITLMGGVTESLVINGHIMDELNLSCDPDATLAVLGAPCTVTMATAQNCLPAFFTRDDLVGRFGAGSWLVNTCDYWFADMDRAYNWHGWTCWDVVAAAALVEPALFDWHRMDVTLYRRFLSVGYLEAAAVAAPCASIYVPRIKDASVFKEHVLQAWERGLEAVRVPGAQA